MDDDDEYSVGSEEVLQSFTDNNETRMKPVSAAISSAPKNQKPKQKHHLAAALPVRRQQ